VRSGVLDIEIQADSVNTGSGLKNNKLKSKDFFDVKDFPTITFKSRKSFRLVQTHSTWKATSPFVASRRKKNSLLQTTARDQLQGKHRRHNGLRSQRLRHEQQHSLHQDRQPCRSKCRSEMEAGQRSSSSFPTIIRNSPKREARQPR